MASEQEYQTKTNSLHSNGSAKNERASGIKIIQEIVGRRWDGRMDGWTNVWSQECVEETGTGNSKVQRENE